MTLKQLNILETSQENSRTWAIHVKYLSAKYGLPDPLECLKNEPPSKNQNTEFAYFEKSLREKSVNNSSMKFLNVSLTCQRGRRHPALFNIITTHEVKKARIHLKMLLGDYLTFHKKSTRSGGPAYCRCCSNSTSRNETLTHILTQCDAYADIRKRMFPEFSQVCRESKSGLNFDKILESTVELSQFILDPSSMNLTPRININDPVLNKLFKISRDYCYTINSTRFGLIQNKKEY